MRTSEILKALPIALLKAQQAITFATKDATNPQFKSKYADLSSVIEAVKPHLNANGITYIQTPIPSDDCRIHLSTLLLHDSGEWIEGTMSMPFLKQDPQGYGSAMTYARRYSLAAMTGLYQYDDDANESSKKNDAPKSSMRDADLKKASVAYLTENQIADIQIVADDCGITTEEVCKAAKVRSLKEIEASRLPGLVKWMKSNSKNKTPE